MGEDTVIWLQEAKLASFYAAYGNVKSTQPLHQPKHNVLCVLCAFFVSFVIKP
jgi:hypothetical protein